MMSVPGSRCFADEGWVKHPPDSMPSPLFSKNETKIKTRELKSLATEGKEVRAAMGFRGWVSESSTR
jgi:hypothetical protein